MKVQALISHGALWFLVKRQQAEETVLGYKESGCDTLALCEKIPWFFYVLSIWHRYTRELPGFHSSTSLVGWETLKAFLKFPAPRPGIEPWTSGMVDQSVTTRTPHHPTIISIS
ncbi:hypothetical protein DPMN_129438 [Dreissena polymorpha]|uniref:Uncharacterized protein n=1 Tax=Dreissena polymorpha TaxID=45954 RepID=A0A9D4H4W8_DREPO|nr:hypothetical protein DPMN_129438 [Dreissena polymorpha]